MKAKKRKYTRREAAEKRDDSMPKKVVEIAAGAGAPIPSSLLLGACKNAEQRPDDFPRVLHEIDGSHHRLIIVRSYHTQRGEWALVGDIAINDEFRAFAAPTRGFPQVFKVNVAPHDEVLS